MEFKFRAVDDRPSPYLSSTPSISYFTEQILRAGYSNSGSLRNELLSNPSDMRETIQRELEKERIREEIIAGEIARRRILEAEVRRELLMEQEMMLSKNELKSSISSAMRLPLFHQTDSRALEERLSRSLEQRLALQAHQEMLAALETTASLRRSMDAAGPEVKPFPEVNKDRVILLPKPELNLSGAKRKAATPPAVGVNELTSVGSKKKLKEEWSCALCQVSATSERGLNEHLQGRKHKAKEAGLIAQRVGKTPALPKKSRRHSKLADIFTVPGSVKVDRADGETLQIAVVGEASVHRKPNAGDIENKNNELLLQRREREDPKRKNGEATKLKGRKPVDPNLKKIYKLWCDLCHVGAYCDVVMANHEKGKKHMARLQLSQPNGLHDLVLSTTIASSPGVTQKSKNVEMTAKEADEKLVEMTAKEADEKPMEMIAQEADEKPVENIEANVDGSGLSSSVNN